MDSGQEFIRAVAGREKRAAKRHLAREVKRVRAELHLPPIKPFKEVLEAMKRLSKAAEQSNLAMLGAMGDLVRALERKERLDLGGDGRPSFDEHFMGHAKQASTRGECHRSQVACVFVRDQRIIATGYNGAEAGAPSCLTGACPRGLLSYDEVAPLTSYTSGPGRCIGIHAEDNGIRDAEKRGIDLDGSTAYVTREPCAWCWKRLAAARVARVLWPEGEAFAPTLAVAILPDTEDDTQHRDALFALAVSEGIESPCVTLGITAVSAWNRDSSGDVLVNGVVGLLQ